MGLEEINYLLRKHGVVPSRVLGQNFLVDPSIYPKIIRYAEITNDDIVLDAGAGLGFFTRYLADRTKAVIAVEKDPQIAQILRKQLKGLTNVNVIEGNVLQVPLPSFNKTISFPPYYLSSRLIPWILDRKIDCSLLILQKEFAKRLVATMGSEEYGWLAVITYQMAAVALLDEIPRWMFLPQPKVDSVIVKLKPLANPTFMVENTPFFRRMLKYLFSQRNRKINNATIAFIRNELKLEKKEAKTFASRARLPDKRIRDLSPKEFGEIVNALKE